MFFFNLSAPCDDTNAAVVNFDDGTICLSLSDDDDQDDDVHRIIFPIESISENMVGTQTLTKNIALEVRRQPLFLCFLRLASPRLLAGIIQLLLDREVEAVVRRLCVASVLSQSNDLHCIYGLVDGACC